MGFPFRCRTGSGQYPAGAPSFPSPLLRPRGLLLFDHPDGVDAFFAKYENKQPGQKKQEVGMAVPFGRMGRPEDLAGMAIFLASDEADYIVAQTYNVDGGQWMS